MIGETFLKAWFAMIAIIGMYVLSGTFVYMTFDIICDLVNDAKRVVNKIKGNNEVKANAC